MEPSFILVDQLSKRYVQAGKTRLVLNKLSLSVKKGEFLAIVGPSGAGKTTLLRLLSGLEPVTDGRVCIAQNALHSFNEAQRAKFRQANVGFAFQLFDLLERITVLENTALPLILAGMVRKTALQQASSMLAMLGVDQLADAFPADISGGEMQRVGLARALIHKPTLLLADEPTSSLDSLDAEKVLELFGSIRQDYPVTIIMVTHNTRAAAYADRVLRLKQGRIIMNQRGHEDA